MKRLYAIILFIFTFSLLASAQDSNVTVIGSGDGNTKTNALNQALRSCIEKSLGAFLSSSTAISNDSLVKDEIVTIASGNIVSYDVLSEINKNENWNVTVSAIISPEKLITTLKSKGYDFELNGGVYAQNAMKEKYYKEQEPIALQNFYTQLKSLQLFDFDINVGEPVTTSTSYGGKNLGRISEDNGWITSALSVADDSIKQFYITHAIVDVNNKILLPKNRNQYYEFVQKVFEPVGTSSFPYIRWNIKELKQIEVGHPMNADEVGGEFYIPVVFSPKFTDTYEKSVVSLVKILLNICLKDVEAFKKLNGAPESVYLELPEFLLYTNKGLASLNSHQYTSNANVFDISNGGTKYYEFMLRNKESLELIKNIFNFIRLSSYPYQYTSEQIETLSNTVVLKINSNQNQYSTQNSYTNLFYPYAHRTDSKRSVITPVGSSENFATVNDTKVKPFLSPTVMLVPCYLDDLAKIKKIKFKSKYAGSEVENEKLGGNNDKNNKKEEFNLYLKNVSDSINSTLKDKSDWVYIFDAVQTKPVIGDTAKFVKYASTQRYPSEAQKNNITGKVVISYITEKDGSVSNVKIYKGIGHGCDEEAIRFISSMPKRIPAQQEGKPVRVITIGAFNCEPIK